MNTERGEQVTTETRSPREDVNHGHNQYSGHGDTWVPVFHSWCPGCRAAQERGERVTTTTNEAAERLRSHLSNLTTERVYSVAWLDALDEALAAERDAATKEHAAEDEVAIAAAFAAGSRHGSRATVERIRERYNALPQGPYRLMQIYAILDEEAAR